MTSWEKRVRIVTWAHPSRYKDNAPTSVVIVHIKKHLMNVCCAIDAQKGHGSIRGILAEGKAGEQECKAY
jgi:hypothetical protein